MKNSYNSYSEIDRQLEILKLEREISYHKAIQSAQNVLDSFTLGNLLKTGIGSIGNSIGNSKELKIFLFSTLLKFLIKKLFKRN